MGGEKIINQNKNKSIYSKVTRNLGVNKETLLSIFDKEEQYLYPDMHGSLVDYCVEFLLLLSGVGIRMLGEDEQDGLEDSVIQLLDSLSVRDDAFSNIAYDILCAP